MFGQAKILMSLVQIVASMPFVLTGVHFSPFFKSMANAFGVVTLDVLALTSPFGCEYSVRFFDRLLVHLLLPVACLLSIGLAVVTVRACISKSNAHEKQMKINQAVSKIIVLIILLIFPGLSTRLFSVFKCQSFPGIEGSISLLVADYSVNCNEAEYHMFAAVATVFVFVYIAGIPLVMFLLLWKNKKHLHNVDSDKHLLVKNALGDLYMQYEPEYWWFELMVLLNKTIMCGGLVVLSPGSPSQVFCGVLFMMFHLLLVLKLSPFLHDSEDTSSIAASLGLTLIYIGALMQMLETTYEDMENKGIDKYDKENLSYVGAVLDVLPVFCVCTVIGIIVVMDCGVYDRFKKKKKKKEEQTETAGRNHTRVKPVLDIGKVMVYQKASNIYESSEEARVAKMKQVEASRACASTRVQQRLAERKKRKIQEEKKQKAKGLAMDGNNSLAAMATKAKGTLRKMGRQKVETMATKLQTTGENNELCLDKRKLAGLLIKLGITDKNTIKQCLNEMMTTGSTQIERNNFLHWVFEEGKQLAGGTKNSEHVL